MELGIEEDNLYISNKTQDYYNPGRSGSVINLKSTNGAQLAFFGEIHPGIVSNMDFKEQNICGFEIFIKIYQSHKKNTGSSKKIILFRSFKNLKEILHL